MRTCPSSAFSSGIHGSDLAYAVLTDTGRVRPHNEDAFRVDETVNLFVVSDGMGGHRAGDRASATVAAMLPRQVRELLESGEHAALDPGLALERGVRHVSLHIRRLMQKVPALRGMGATVVACLIRDERLHLAHMGDSRAYRLRDGLFEGLTEDHSLVALLRGMDLITPKQAELHPARNTISRYVGMGEEIGPEMQALDLRKGDRLLLCTDGLTNSLSDRRIGKVLHSEGDIEAVCRKLVDAANAAGGRDNTTVMVIQYGVPGSGEKRGFRVKRRPRRRDRRNLWQFIEQRI